MKAVAYTIGGSAAPVQALRDAGETIAIRNIGYFDGVEGYQVVGLEVEDERIRAAYESVGANVSVIAPSISDDERRAQLAEVLAQGNGTHVSESKADEAVVAKAKDAESVPSAAEKAPVPDVAPAAENVEVSITNDSGSEVEVTVTKEPEDVTPPAPKAGKRK